MAHLITTQARAYINFGRWVAECPLECGNALALQPNQVQFFCAPPGGCGHAGSIEWPDDAQGLWDALEGRAPKNKNWFPPSHNLAIRANCPHGQTPEQLRDETEEMTRG
jgi:hypothetical protein